MDSRLRSFQHAWALRSLHNVAVGISEMHEIQVAHQDVKPSNILLFDSQNTSKLGDVGRSSSMSMPAAHDRISCAGDISYSPFEQLYGESHPDWKVRRYSCDMFMFGNLIMTYFNNISVTAAVLGNMPADHRPDRWGDSYQAILPTIEMHFSKCVEHFNDSIDEELRCELMNMVRQLCNPDVFKRGDLSSAHLGSQQYSLRKYVSRLDYWAKRCPHVTQRRLSHLFNVGLLRPVTRSVQTTGTELPYK